jgi:predicted transcriptional regulator
VDSEIVRTVLANNLEKRGAIRWEDYIYPGSSLEDVATTPDPSVRFSTIDAPLNDTKLMTALQKDFADWVYRTTSVKARANQALKVFAGPDISQAEFMRACADAARQARDAEVEKKESTILRRIQALEEKLNREGRELREDEAELSHRKMEEAGTHFENLTGLFGGRRSARRLSSSLSKRRMTEQAKADVEESQDAIDDFKNELTQLERRRQEIIAEIHDKWGKVVGDASEVTVIPKKSDIFVSLFGVAWMPHYMIRTASETIEIPAFGAQ